MTVLKMIERFIHIKDKLLESIEYIITSIKYNKKTAKKKKQKF